MQERGMKKTLIGMLKIAVWIIILSAWFAGCAEPAPPPKNTPPLKVQAIQIKEAVMSDTIALNGTLQRRKTLMAVLDAGAECTKKCKKGLEAMVRIEGHPIGYRGKVSLVSQSGGGYHVEIPLSRAPASLRCGTPVHGTIYGDLASPALIVPWSAVDRRAEYCVWQVNPDKKARRVLVNLGSYDNNLVAISGDVQKDDWVVIAPHDALSNDCDLDVSEIY